MRNITIDIPGRDEEVDETEVDETTGPYRVWMDVESDYYIRCPLKDQQCSPDCALCSIDWDDTSKALPEGQRAYCRAYEHAVPIGWVV